MDSGICYNCGAVYDRPDGGCCPDCGAVIVKNELPKVEKRLSAAFLLLRESQFDEAKTAFEAILKKYPENALAYWGRFRARYHITYVLNADGKQVAKCPTELFEVEVSQPSPRGRLTNYIAKSQLILLTHASDPKTKNFKNRFSQPSCIFEKNMLQYHYMFVIPERQYIAQCRRR